MPNGTVEGTSGDDFIVTGYVDADGDSIDGADGVDDIIVAGAGDDIVIGDAGNDTMFGGDGLDLLKGFAGNDVISGGAGANDIYGGAGQDVLVGGAGADTFYGGTDQDNLDYSGSSAGVNVDLSTGAVSGGDAANDTLVSGVDGVIGSGFDDVLVGFDAQGTDPSDIYTNEFYGGAGNDSISSLDGDDIIDGGTGNDTLDGGLGADEISGGDDRDTIIADAGDVVDGGAGGDDFDTLDLRGQGPVNIINTTVDSNGNGQNGTVEFLDASGGVTGTLDFTEIESILTDGGNSAPIAGDDTATALENGSVVIDVLANDSDPDGDPVSVLGTPTADNGTVAVNGDGTITYTPDPGYFGPDTITYQITDGNGGTDTGQVGVTVAEVTGLDGTVTGTAGDDLIDLTYTGDPDGDMIDNNDALPAGGDADVVEAGDGNDTVFSGAGDDVVFGGAGDDLISGGIGADTITGGDGGDSVLGGDGDDVIDTSGPVTAIDGLPDRGYPGLFPDDVDPTNDLDTVDGGAGNDTILTGDDNDSIQGGAGDDTIDGGADDDIIAGGTGNDFIVGGEGADDIDGGTGDDVIYGGLDPSAPDIFNIPDATDLRPDNGLDTIRGGDGNDTIFGADDDDLLFGDAGNDVIDGGIDDDTIFGGTDDDIITGGEGADVMSGGDGQDTFVIGSAADGNGDVADGGSGGVDFDILDLSGAGDFQIVGETLDADGNSTSGTVEFLDAPGGAVIGSMGFSEIERIVPCFTPGTLIATMRGEKRVEQLQVGDKIITRDNGAQEIRWIGFKPMSGSDLQAAPDLQPILIRQGALGKGLPERDMLVSPNHRLLVHNSDVNLYFNENEVLVPAKHLLESGVGVQTICQTGTSYIHFMFDNHEVVLSDGTWTESFQPGDMALNGIADEQRGEIFALFPELALPEGREAFAAARHSLKKHEARLLFK